MQQRLDVPAWLESPELRLDWAEKDWAQTDGCVVLASELVSVGH